MADEIRQTILIEANISSVQNDLKTLENNFKTSFKGIGAAGIESFASIDAAAAKFSAAQATVTARAASAASRLSVISNLSAARLPGGSAARSEAQETARFEKIRQDALNASRNAFKEFEATVRSGGKNISGSLAGNAASATALGSSLSGVIGIAKSLGLVLGPLAILGFAKSSFTAVGAIQDLADSSGIAADMLFKLKPVMEGAGSSAEELAKIVNVMQAKIVEGSAETVDTLDKLGISMQQALALADDPEGLLDKMAKGLANVATQAERVNIEKAIGGRGAVKALETLASPLGLQPIRDRKAIISKEEIDAIDKAGDSLNELRIKLEAIAAVKVLGVIEFFTGLGDAITSVLDKAEALRLKLPKILAGPSPAELAATIAKNKGEQSLKIAPTTKDTALKREQIDAEVGGAVGTIASKGAEFSDNQKLFNKSLQETIDGLRAQTRALTESGDAAADHAAKILADKAATLGFAKGSAELTAKLNEFKAATLELKQATFADSLIKQNQAIEVQIATMTQGAEAGQRLALQYAINNARLGQMSKASREAADAQAVLNKKLAEAVIPQAQKALADDTTEARQRLEIQGPSFNLAAATKEAKQKFIDAMLAVRGSPELKALAIKAVLKVIPELDRDKLPAILSDIDIALKAATDKGAVLNQVFGNTFDVGSAKIDKMREALAAMAVEAGNLAEQVKKQEVAIAGAQAQRSSAPNQSSINLIKASGFSAADKDNMTAALGAISSSSKIAGADIEKMTAELDAARKTSDAFNASLQKLAAATDAAEIANAFKQIDRDIAIAENQAILFGNAFDLAGAKVQAVQSALEGLTSKGIKASNPDAQQIAGRLSAQKLSSTLSDLRKEMALSADEAQVLGGAVNLPAENIDKLTNAIRILVKEFGPLHPELQQLKAELEAARAASDLADGFKDMASAAVGAINDLSNGSSLKDALKNLGSRISSALTAALVTKPLERMIDEWVNGLSLPGGLLGGLFGTQKLPQGFGERPAGVEGPSLAGGFFSTAKGGAIPGADAAAAAIQAQSTTATTAITSLQTEAITALQLNATEGTTAIRTIGTTAETSIFAVKDVAIAAIQTMAAQGGGANLPTGGFGALFGGAEANYGGTSLIEDVFSFAHSGGPIKARKMHDGGEVPIMAQAGEFMMSKKAAERIGVKTLEKMNAGTMNLPKMHGGGAITSPGGGLMPDKWSPGRMAVPNLERMGATGTAAQNSVMSNSNRVNNYNYNQTVNAKDAGTFRTSKRAIFGQARNAFQNLG